MAMQLTCCPSEGLHSLPATPLCLTTPLGDVQDWPLQRCWCPVSPRDPTQGRYSFLLSWGSSPSSCQPHSSLVSCCSLHPRPYISHCPPQFMPLPSGFPPPHPLPSIPVLCSPLPPPSRSSLPLPVSPCPNVPCPFPGPYPVSSHLPLIFLLGYVLDLFSTGPAAVPGGGAGVETQPVTALALGKANYQLCAARSPPGAGSCLEVLFCGCVAHCAHGSVTALT